ncbi:hypothetical protein FGIG_06336 [Fasciola gigantica]|uniref:Uncharacterized protein n=1 Tax=Fasciola gigantica TaxID=46835 RepID=A0A504YXU7_FASGI|nr:hypothetical protein FGIG_06336 [Fasciola gigantica]
MDQHQLTKPFQTHSSYSVSGQQCAPVAVGSYAYTVSLPAPGPSVCGSGSGPGGSCGEGRSSSSTSSIVSVPALASIGSPTRPDSQSDYLAQRRLAPSPNMRDDYGMVIRPTKPVPIHGPPSVPTGFAQSVSPASHVRVFCFSVDCTPNVTRVS